MARFNGVSHSDGSPGERSIPGQAVPRIAGRATSAVRTLNEEITTYEGGKAYLRDEKSELFQLAVVNMVGQDTFYEGAGDRDSRYVQLVRQLAVSDFTWTFNLLRWLRGPEGNLRTASLVGAAEAVHARLEAGDHGASGATVPDPRDSVATSDVATNRRLIEAVLQRADEPGELLAYWTGKFGRKLPQPVKRGVADAVRRLYTERGFLRYDSESKGFRFADVIDLVHPKTDVEWQGDLFRHALNARHGHDEIIPETLFGVRARRAINAQTPDKRHQLAQLALKHGLGHSSYERAMAGQWEWLHSVLGDTTGARNPISKADQWRLVLPQLGYMALLRNLRNLEQAGLTAAEMRQVGERLADADEVAKSRQFPFRFWSAHRATNGVSFASYLEQAIGHSMRNIPALPGKSLVLVDTSASMTSGVFDKRSTMTPVQAGALFGVALTVRNPGNVHLVGFATGEFQHTVMGGASMLRETERFIACVGKVGHGTDIHGAVARTFRKGYHDRVFIITDMQTIGGGYRNVESLVPANVPVYAFNLGGYRQSMMRTGVGNRHEFGGLSDSTFKNVPLLEKGIDTGWPWEITR